MSIAFSAATRRLCGVGTAVITLLTIAGPASALCSNVPMTTCAYASNFSRLHIQQGIFLWKWRRGSLFGADVGDPVGSTDFNLCIYTDGNLIDDIAIPHGGQCRSHPCWHQLDDRGFAYRDPEGANGGVNWVKMKLSPKKAIMKIKGRGPNVFFPLPFTVTNAVTMQLQNSIGNCWEAIFPRPAVKESSSRYIDVTHPDW